MSADARRVQLLAAAREIVQHRGVAALTLANLATVCGVSKPIAYNHFGTRERLLAELYQELGAEHDASARAALDRLRADGGTRSQAALTIAAALINCLIQNGPLYDAIMAALRASPDGSRLAEELNEAIVAAYATALAELGDDPDRSRALVRAMIGASEGLVAAIIKGEVRQDAAIALLARLIGDD
jgi:AcrR family transcriptional regulator